MQSFKILECLCNYGINRLMMWSMLKESYDFILQKTHSNKSKNNRVTYRGALHPKNTLHGYAYQI